MEFFWTELKKAWLKPKSIPFLAAILIAASWAILPRVKAAADGEAVVRNQLCILLLGACILVIYAVACVLKNRLRRAPKGTLAVLFVVDAESDQLFESVRFKLVNTFQDLVSSEEFAPFAAVCVKKEQVSKYTTSKSTDKAIELLLRTNCIFLINVRCLVDDVTKAENYELLINSGILHPSFNDAGQKILQRDLVALCASVGKQKFAKAQTIDVFTSTAQSLRFTCEYILGLVYLLSGNTNEALNLLEGIKQNMLRSSLRTQEERSRFAMVQEKLFITLLKVAGNSLSNFEKDKGKHYLAVMRGALEEANKIYPETYDYNLSMAYIFVALDKDARKAKECIEKCKKTTQDEKWRYSDAFISAYLNYSPMTICAKYREAFKVPYNLINIVDYIEFMLEEEPDKTALHLAAGLVYEEIGDPVQMKVHLTKYLETVATKNARVESRLREKMSGARCGVECDNNCLSCNAHLKV